MSSLEPSDLHVTAPVERSHAGQTASAGLAPYLVFVLGLVGTAAAAAVIWLASDAAALLVVIYVATLAALLGLVVIEHQAGRDCTPPLLGLIASAAIGPPGAIGAAVLSEVLFRNPADGGLLAAWYDRISLATASDPVARLCDDVGVGRTVRSADPAPASYAAIIERGPLSERHAVLGLIARRFHPDYLPVLRRALLSPEPAIRVQAAAVAAHLRPELSRYARACETELPRALTSPSAAIGLLSRMEAAVLSGFLDAADERRLREIIPRLADVVVASFRQARCDREIDRKLAASDALSATLERVLLARERFADLRSLRSARRVLVGRPRSRIRRIAPRRSFAGAAE
jgi:hypothetical protein